MLCMPLPSLPFDLLHNEWILIVCDDCRLGSALDNENHAIAGMQNALIRVFGSLEGVEEALDVEF